MDAAMNDFRIALRQYVRQRGFALTVVCTLAVTVGATTAVFSVVNTVLVRALPFSSPERLVWIASVRPDNPSAPFSLPEFMDYRGRTRTLSGLAAYANWSASLAGASVTERLQGARMSANAFDVLGVSPAAGRLLNEGDDRADAPQVVVLSYRLWQQYGGAADTVGKTVRINSESFVIVGVLPAQFPLPLQDLDVVTPLAPDRDPLRHVRNSVNFLRVFGRLKTGTDRNQAQSELTAICRALRQQFPVEYARKEAVRVDALHEALVGDFRQSMLLLLLLRTVPFSVAGQSAAERDRPSANLRAISPGYLSTVSTRLVQGRLFSETDGANTPRVALVSAALADRFLSGGALGQQLLIHDNNEGPRPIEIVGVVENVHHIALDLPPALDIYIPLRQIHPDGVSFLRDNQFWMVRTGLDPAAFRATFLMHLRAVDPDAAVSGTGTMRQFLEDSLGPRRFNLGLFGAFASTAVLLALVGLYGLVSYAVSQRAQEIGLRMAIGATQRDVQLMILRQAAKLGIAGAAAGLALAGAVRPLISGMVPSTGLRAGQDVWISPAVAAVTAALLIGVVLMAAWLPARRAARIEPTLALK